MLRVTVDAERVQYYLQNLPENIELSVLQAMRQIVIELQSKIRAEKLHGDPLHQRSGNLSRETLTQPDPYRDGHNILGTVGTSSAAPYGKVHEYGGTFTIPEHMSMSRRGRRFTVRAHQATFPERSYLRSTLAESQARITALVQAAIEQAIAT